MTNDSQYSKYVLGNWKMNPVSRASGEQIVRDLAALLKGQECTSVMVGLAPKDLHIESVKRTVGECNVQIAIGGQNCASQDKGAFTGQTRYFYESGCEIICRFYFRLQPREPNNL